jgi:hypothetical protein
MEQGLRLGAEVRIAHGPRLRDERKLGYQEEMLVLKRVVPHAMKIYAISRALIKPRSYFKLLAKQELLLLPRPRRQTPLRPAITREEYLKIPAKPK